MKKIDLNCDMGESYGNFKVGNDAEIMPYISSCNLACGFHGGDPFTLKSTIELALQYEVKIGAHPSYPDLSGFGRRKIDMPYNDLLALLEYQIAAVKGMVEAAGGVLHHVKPHGALYNAASTDNGIAHCINEAIANIDKKILLYGPAGNSWVESANQFGIRYVQEVFSDRRYNNDLTLVTRNNPDALIHDQKESLDQIHDMLIKKIVKSIDGQELSIEAETICIHGDKPGAAQLAEKVNLLLRDLNVHIEAP